MARDAGSSRRSGRPHPSLRGRTSFAEVRRRGSRRSVGKVAVLVAAGPPGPPRVGFVAGKRLGGAVARNRAKRRLRQAMAQVALPPGTRFVVIAQEGVNEVPFDRLVEWLEQAVAVGGTVRP